MLSLRKQLFYRNFRVPSSIEIGFCIFSGNFRDFYRMDWVGIFFIKKKKPDKYIMSLECCIYCVGVIGQNFLDYIVNMFF